MIKGVSYDKIDEDGLHITFGENRDKSRVLAVDDVVVCAGQESRRELLDELRAARVTVHLVGGADVAVELDAKRAIDQGTRLAASF
jgi:2,4-dienoyl-CoA reductase (NADPH2)